MKLKKAILPLCKAFPATHKRAGEKTDFEGKIERKEKIHTIRYDEKGIWERRFARIKAGAMYLAMKEWTGRPYNSVQRDLAMRTREDGIGLQKIQMAYGVNDAYPRIWIDGKEVSVQIVAQNDGLSVEDFVEWFFGNGKVNTFEGVVIHFTDFRY